MKSPFNTYYEKMDSDFWRTLCVEKGEYQRRNVNKRINAGGEANQSTAGGR